jgi:hypothetical protein
MHINTSQMPGPGDLVLRNPFDADEFVFDRDDTIQILADHYWDTEIGETVSGRDISEALGGVLDGMDPDELRALSTANEDGAHALGEFLHPKIAGYWKAWCEEEARKALDKLDREDEEDAARDRMEDQR